MLLCHNVGLQNGQKQTRFDIIDNLGILNMNLFIVRIKNLNFKSSDNPLGVNRTEHTDVIRYLSVIQYNSM